jgi:hypothetical protein
MIWVTTTLPMQKRKRSNRPKLLKPVVTEQRQRQKQARRDDETLVTKQRERKRSNAEVAEVLHQRAIAQSEQVITNNGEYEQTD